MEELSRRTGKAEMATSASPRLRGQMLASLPAGQVVESEMAEILSEPPSGETGWATEEVWAPTPSRVSLKTVLDYGDPRSPAMAAVVAGLRDPAAVAEMRERLNAGSWPKGRLTSAALCNSKLSLDGEVHLSPSQDIADIDENETLSFAVVDAVLRGELTLAENLKMRLAPQVVRSLEDSLGWWAVGEPNKALLQKPLPRVAEGWERLAEATLDDPAAQGAGLGSSVLNTWKVMRGCTRSFPTHAVSGFAFGPHFDLLVSAVECPALDLGSMRGHTTGIGRHMGRRLFEVTGDDPGLWSVAIQLLQDWDRPFREWLEAVESLS